MMHVSFLKGTTAQNDAYTGPAGTITVDTELNKIRLHDGWTPGGLIIGNWGDASVTPFAINLLSAEDAESGRSALNLGDAALHDAVSFGGYHNKLLNGCMRINQDGLSWTLAPGETRYTSDQWRIVNSTDVTVDVAISSMTIPGVGEVPRLRFSAPVAPTAGDLYITQPIEDVLTLAGTTATASFYLATAENVTSHVYFNQYFGVGGSETVFGAGGTTAIATDDTLTRRVGTVSVPSVESKILGPGHRLEFVVGVPLRTTAAVTFSFAQVEEGDRVTPFRRRHKLTELFLCQRYFETGIAGWEGYMLADHWTSARTRWRAPKRTVPSLTHSVVEHSDMTMDSGAWQPDTDGSNFSVLKNATAGWGRWRVAWTASARF